MYIYICRSISFSVEFCRWSLISVVRNARHAMSKIIGLLERLADLWIVGKCKCFMQRSKSFTHVDCLQLEPWVLEELNVCAALRRYIIQLRTKTGIRGVDSTFL